MRMSGSLYPAIALNEVVPEKRGLISNGMTTPSTTRHCTFTGAVGYNDAAMVSQALRTKGQFATCPCDMPVDITSRDPNSERPDLLGTCVRIVKALLMTRLIAIELIRTPSAPNSTPTVYSPSGQPMYS